MKRISMKEIQSILKWAVLYDIISLIRPRYMWRVHSKWLLKSQADKNRPKTKPFQLPTIPKKSADFQELTGCA